MTHATAPRPGGRSRPPRRRWSGRAVAAVLALVVVLLGQLAGASTAAAHAELVSATPADGTVLDRPPSQVTLTFTEAVNLVSGGLQLLDPDGTAVPTPEPVVEGDTVRWPMPAALPDGGYLVDWRVVSADGHPVSGAFSFAVGADAAPPPVSAAPTATPDAPWPVSLAKFGGYLGFSLLAGVLAFTSLCWPRGRDHARTHALLRLGLALGIASTVAGLLLQGPYGAGEPLTRASDTTLLTDTLRTGFGAWTQVRLSLLLALAVVLWPRGTLGSPTVRLPAALGVVVTAVTFPGTGHAADGAVWARAVDSAHVLLAGGWVGGLVLLAVLATDRQDRPGLDALRAFSRLALLSVVGILVTGTLNALLRITALSALWDTGYGRLLSLKVAVLALALAVAAWARTRVRSGTPPGNILRLEAVSTVAVLVLTAALASTAPSATAPASAAPAAARSSTTVEMDLGEGRRALLHIDPPTTRGSTLHLELLDADDRPFDAASAELRTALPERELGPLDARLTGGPSDWTGDLSFPLPGKWRLTLTVEDQEGTGLVTAGEVTIS